MAEKKSKIVKNTTKAFNYNYASLADISEQGYDIPETRIVPKFTPDGSTFIGNYMEYKDDDGEWITAIPVPSPDKLEMGGKANICQKLGSISTYCRRYCTLQKHGLACLDDQELESKPPQRSELKRLDFDEVRVRLAMINTIQELKSYWTTLKPSTPKQTEALKNMFAKRKEELGG